MTRSGRLHSTVKDRSFLAKMNRAQELGDPEVDEAIRDLIAAPPEVREEFRTFINELKVTKDAEVAKQRSGERKRLASATDGETLISKKIASGESKPFGVLADSSSVSADAMIGASDRRHAANERDEGPGPEEFAPLQDLSDSERKPVIADSKTDSDKQRPADANKVDAPVGDAASLSAADAATPSRSLSGKEVRDSLHQGSCCDCDVQEQRRTLPTDRSPEVKIAFERYQHELVLMFEIKYRSQCAFEYAFLSQLMQDHAEGWLSLARKHLSDLEKTFEASLDPETGYKTEYFRSTLAALIRQARAKVAKEQQSFERATQKSTEAAARAESADQLRTAQDQRHLLALDDLKKAYIAFVETKQRGGPSTSDALDRYERNEVGPPREQ